MLSNEESQTGHTQNYFYDNIFDDVKETLCNLRSKKINVDNIIIHVSSTNLRT